MIERSGTLLRASEPEPPAPAFVHTIEVGPTFITLWVCSAQHAPHPAMAALLAADPSLAEIAEHEPALFHPDDETYRWVETRYAGKARVNWRQHYHWRYDRAPTHDDLEAIVDLLPPGAVPGTLLAEVYANFYVRPGPPSRNLGEAPGVAASPSF